MKRPAAACVAALLLAIAQGCGRSTVGGSAAAAPSPAPPPASGPPAAQTTTSASTTTSGSGTPIVPPEGSAKAPGAPPAAFADGTPLIVESPDLVHIEYRMYGRGDPAIVLVHGWSCSSAYWSAQIDELKSRYTVVTVDLAGHGASGRNRTDWSMGRYGSDVAAVVRRIASPHVVLVGHSMGGPVALEAAARIGARVIGVIGVDTFKSLDLPPPAREQVDKQVEPFRMDFIGAMHRFVPQFLFRRGTDPGLVRKVTDDMAREPPQIAVATLIALNALDFATVPPLVHAPIVAINSDLGRPTNEARIRRIVPGFRAVVLKGDDHFLMLDDARRFNPILLREIGALASAGLRTPAS